MASPIPTEALHLFDERNLAHLSTLNADGSPQCSPVWVERDGEEILVNTSEGRVKHRNIERDGRVALSIHNQDNIYESLAVQGVAAIEDRGEAAVAQIHRLAKKYLGVDEYPVLRPGERRISVRVTPEKAFYMNVRA